MNTQKNTFTSSVESYITVLQSQAFCRASETPQLHTALAASALGIQPDILGQEPAMLGKCGGRIHIKC